MNNDHPEKKILFLVFLTFSIIYHIGCSKQHEKNDQLTNELSVIRIDSTVIDRGLFFRQGRNVHFQKVSDILIKTRSQNYQITKYGHCQYLRGRIYILDRFIPEIYVFDKKGQYLKTIRIKMNRVPKGSIFSELLILNNTDLLVKNARFSTVFWIDSTGTILKTFSSGDSGIFLAPRNMDIVRTSNGIHVYSIIWQGIKSKKEYSNIFSHALRIGHFNERGELVKRFGQFDPLYEKYNLEPFMPTTLRVWNKRIYHLQQALPFVQVFTLSGDYLGQFGVPGIHMRPIEKIPKQLDSEMQTKILQRHSLFSGIYILTHCPGYPDPILLVFYQNTDELGEKHNYIILYSEEGEVLLNDLEIPAVPQQTINGSKLLLVYRIEKDVVRLGIFELSVSSK